MLDAMGVSAGSSLMAPLLSSKSIYAWPVRVRRPVKGDVVVPRRRGRRFCTGDVAIFTDKRLSHGQAVRIDHVFGLCARATHKREANVVDSSGEDHPMIALSIDLITLLVDILPGKDAFVALDVWASSEVPLPVFKARPIKNPPTADFRFRFIGENSIDFRVDCDRCAASGKVNCRPCDGRGSFPCDKCNATGYCSKCGGAGDFECGRCGGSGKVTRTCKKCDGSGDFVGKYGDVMGRCNRCDGSGEVSFNCRGCEGRGRRTCIICEGSGHCNRCGGYKQTDCRNCGGSGALQCRGCSGDGHVPARFFFNNGEYHLGKRVLAEEDVFALDQASGDKYNLSRGASKKLEFMLREAERLARRQEHLRDLQETLSGIDECLEHSMESAGITRQALDFKTLHLGRPAPAPARKKGRKILAFPVIGTPSWLRRGECPLEAGTPMRFRTERNGGRDIELADLLSEKGRRQLKNLGCSFWGTGIAGAREILLEMPDSVDESLFTDSFWCDTDLIPPAELAQQRELAGWCRPNEAPELLETLLPPYEAMVRDFPKVTPFNAALAENPRQLEALEMILSERSLVLVKGPPGTGKTTVITEAVLQQVSEGKRVLICSETHQAVCNVLEKLHEIGGVRMIRHGREEKVAEQEKEYLEDGSKNKFLKTIFQCICKNRKSYSRLGERLEPLPKVIGVAAKAAARLEAKVSGLEDKINTSRNQHAQDIESFRKSEENETENVIRDAQAEIESYKEARESHLELLHKAENSLIKATERRDAIIGKYRKRFGEDPPGESGETPAASSVFKRILPKALAGRGELSRRYAVQTNKMEDAESSVREHAEVAEAFARDVENRQTKMVDDCEAIKANYEKMCDKSSNKLSAAEKKHEKALEEEHAKYHPAQLEAAEMWKFAGLPNRLDRGVCTEDEWVARKEEALMQIERCSQMEDFLQRWTRAAEAASTSELTELFWNSNQVFFSTCVGLASWRSFHKNFGREGVDLVIVDEAAHATMTQTLLPMGSAKRIVLIGDEMQLPPSPPMELRGKCADTCSSRTCLRQKSSKGLMSFKPPMSNCWLERSAFEWLSEKCPHLPRVMLNRQFRMHPDIADFIGGVFYNGELENGVSSGDRKLAFGEFKKAVCLVSTSEYKDRYEERPSGGSTSYLNSLEVRLTKRILSIAANELDEKCSFGVVTPYAAQRELMVGELSDYFVGRGKLAIGRDDIASVDSFQGSERDVMIASFVRSPRRCSRCDGSGKKKGGRCSHCRGSGITGGGLRWVHDLRRLNVAFSRARKMLILIGDINVLTDSAHGTGDGAEVLTRFREHVHDRGYVQHVWERGGDE